MARSLFRHVLVPHDFSPQATVALKTAAQLAKEHRGNLTVLHVLVPFIRRRSRKSLRSRWASSARFSSAWSPRRWEQVGRR